MKLLRIFIFLLCVFSPWLSAEDIARDLRGNGSAPNHNDGGYFELGFGAAYVVDPFLDGRGDCDSHKICPSVLASGAYRYKSAFIELADATNDGLNLGYSVWDDHHWAADLIVLNVFGEPSGDRLKSDDPERQKELNLIQRSRLFAGSGARVTGYFDNTILQLRWVSDLTNQHGAAGSLRLGRSWQYRNWNYHSMVSADWLSARASNYLIGISPAEATHQFPAYHVGSSTYFSAEVGLTYPLSNHWVSRTYFRYSMLPDEVYRSSLIDENHGTVLATTINYAF